VPEFVKGGIRYRLQGSTKNDNQVLWSVTDTDQGCLVKPDPDPEYHNHQRKYPVKNLNLDILPSWIRTLTKYGTLQYTDYVPYAQ
jgi:hypothetical protein